MKTIVVAAPGESLTHEMIVEVSKHFPIIAVSSAFQRAPSAMALVAQDNKWWNAHPEALNLPCDKWSSNYIPEVSRIRPNEFVRSATNSGLAAIYVAITEYEAERILLLGFDMKGEHFFGRYDQPELSNTTVARFNDFRAQFATFARAFRDRAQVFNCTPDSALDVFEKRELDEFLPQQISELMAEQPA